MLKIWETKLFIGEKLEIVKKMYKNYEKYEK